MSEQYDNYLITHKENVKKGFIWLLNNGLINTDEETISEIKWLIDTAHDFSKYSDEEYDAYDDYFYGGNRSYAVVENFNRAWLNHIHSNPHHWQHWVLHNDDPSEGVIVLDMPYKYVVEMICDWWSFSLKSNNLTSIFDWYDEHKSYIMLSDKTRDTVENLLSCIKNKLGEIGNG